MSKWRAAKRRFANGGKALNIRVRSRDKSKWEAAKRRICEWRRGSEHTSKKPRQEQMGSREGIL